MTDSQKNLLYRTLFFTVIIAAVYWSTFSNRFVWDDLDVIMKNRLLEHVGNLPKLFFYEDRTGDGFTGYYRPMTYISFLFDRTLWGLNPVGFNITNIFLHVAVSLTFFSVISSLFKKEWLSWVATLIFALHPVANETVNFHAGGRNTLLCAFFGLLSLLFYIRKKDVLSVICFTAAIFSKEFALLLPAVFFLYDQFLRGEKRNWLRYAPYAVAMACYLTLRSLTVAKAANPLQAVQMGSNLLLAPQLIGSYIKNMLFPFDLKVIYELDPGVSILSVLLVIGAIAAAVVFRKRAEVVAGIGWFFLFLVPVSGILPLGSTFIADRYAYFALMGFSLAVAYVICKLDRRAIAAVTAAACICFAVVDMQRNAIWNSLLPLYMQMTKDAPNRSIGFTNVGMYYYERGDLANAEKYLEISCNKKGIVIRDAMQYLSAIYWETNQYDKALDVLKRMMATEPGNPQPYIMASRIYEAKGDTVLAKQYHDRVEAMFPGIDQMMEGRVVALCREGEKLVAEHKPDQAERKFKEALMMKPDFVPALLDMGGLVAEKGDPGRALTHFSKAQSLEPNNATVHYNLAMVYDMMGKRGESESEMKRFNELSGKANR